MEKHRRRGPKGGGRVNRPDPTENGAEVSVLLALFSNASVGHQLHFLSQLGQLSNSAFSAITVAAFRSDIK